MDQGKQRYLLDSVEATLDAAIRDPTLFEVELPAGIDSDTFASECEVQLASVEMKKTDSLGADTRTAVPCVDASQAYPCDLQPSNLRRPGVDLLLQMLVSSIDEAKAIIAIMSTGTFPRDVSLMAQQSTSNPLKGVLQFSEPKIVHVRKGAKSKGKGGITNSISAHVHYARSIVGRMKAHHWALLMGILLGISAFFTIYKAAIIRAKEELENRRAWRKRNLQDGKELAAQEQAVRHFTPPETGQRVSRQRVSRRVPRTKF
jgi:hypothetical protein